MQACPQPERFVDSLAESLAADECKKDIGIEQITAIQPRISSSA
jgi:hypothetical protein